jgi:hypothetical protein
MVQRPPAAASISARMPAGESLDLGPPGLAFAWRHPGEELPQDRAGVADQPHLGGDVLADLGGIELDVNHLRVPGERREVAGDPIVEPQSHAQDQVRLLDGAVHVHLAVHARHAEMQRMRLGEPADPEQCGDHRGPGALRQLPQLLVRARDDDSVPGHDQGATGLRQQPDCVFKGGGKAVRR